MKENKNSFISVFFVKNSITFCPYGHGALILATAAAIAATAVVAAAPTAAAAAAPDDDQQNDDPDRKCSDDGYGLQICHGIIGEDQGDGQQHQQDRPEQLHIPMRFFTGWQGLIGIGGSYHG